MADETEGSTGLGAAGKGTERPRRLALPVVSAGVVGATVMLVGALSPVAGATSLLAANLLLAMTTLLACLGVGRVVLGALEAFSGLPVVVSGPGVCDHSVDSRLVALIVGLPLYGTLCFLVGNVSLHTGLLAGLMLGCGLLGVLALRSPGTHPKTHPETQADTRSGAAPAAANAGRLWQLLLCAPLALAVAMALAMALGPPATLDEVAYHLAVPKLWLLRGRIDALPLLSHASFPFGAQSASLPLLALAGHGGAVASHLIHWSHACAVLLFIQRWLAPAIGASAAWLGSLVVAATPALLLTAGTSWVDWSTLGAALVAIASADACLQGDRPQRAGFAGLGAAIAAGLLTKYTFLALLGPLWIALMVRSAKHPSLRTPLLRTTLAAGALGCVFFVRNVLQTGNPLSPFGDPLAPHVENYASGGGALTLLSRYVFHPQMADESLGVALPAAMAVGLVGLGKRSQHGQPGTRDIALGLLFSLGVSLLGAPSSRLLMPFAVPLSLLALRHHVREGGPGWRTQGPLLALGLAAAVQLAFIVPALQQQNPMQVWSEAGGLRAYLQRVRPNAARIGWLNDRLPAGSRTLAIGLQEPYWFERDVLSGGNFDGPRIAHYLSEGGTEAFVKRLDRDHVTHLALYALGIRVGTGGGAGAGPRRVEGRRAERRTSLTEEQTLQLHRFLARHTRPLGTHEGVGLFVRTKHAPRVESAVEP